MFFSYYKTCKCPCTHAPLPTTLTTSFLSDVLLLSRHHVVWNITLVTSCTVYVISKDPAYWRVGMGQCWRDIAVQEEPKHWCVMNTFVDTFTKHSASRAAMGKINFILSGPNTVPSANLLRMHYIPLCIPLIKMLNSTGPGRDF